MSKQGLKVLDTTSHKTHEWIARIAESTHLEKRDAWKSLRAVLQTLRDCLPVDVAVHFGAQLPMLVRGAYYEGWNLDRVPMTLSREQFITMLQSRIKAEPIIDLGEAVENVLAVIADHIAQGEMHKICRGLPRDVQTLFPAQLQKG